MRRADLTVGEEYAHSDRRDWIDSYVRKVRLLSLTPLVSRRGYYSGATQTVTVVENGVKHVVSGVREARQTDHASSHLFAVMWLDSHAEGHIVAVPARSLVGHYEEAAAAVAGRALLRREQRERSNTAANERKARVDAVSARLIDLGYDVRRLDQSGSGVVVPLSVLENLIDTAPSLRR